MTTRAPGDGATRPRIVREERPARAPEAAKPEPAASVAEGHKWQVLLMEYEILDSYWIHLHERIWFSALVLIALSMLGITFLGTGMPTGTPQLTLVTFVATVAILLTLVWWALVRRMLSYMRITEYRKQEIERELGMRMELYMGFARERRGRRRAREAVQEMAGGKPDLREDLSSFLDSPVAPTMSPMMPGERVVWNLLPLLFVGAWAVLWIIVR